MLAQEVIKLSSELISFWQSRNAQFRTWYDIVTLVDKLKQPNLESFVSNEPRTFYNLALHLLTPERVLSKITTEEAEPELLEDIKVTEAFLNKTFERFEANSLRRGRGGFLRELISFMLLTGWYSVFSLATEDEIIAEVWSPAETYPEYSEEGLLRCVHHYTVSGRAVQRKAQLKGWELQTRYPPRASVKVFDYWTIEDGIVRNAIVVGNDLVKDLVEERSLSKIPIYISPIGGLPDRGAIVPGEGWKKTIGQSIFAANEQMYEQTNKAFTFLLQLLRDTAQPRWVEYSTGEAKVVPEQLEKRGAFVHLAPTDRLETIPMPPIPIELRALLLDISAMRQKGSLPDVMYGAGAQEITGYMMHQVSTAATHILKPYHQALKFCLQEMCNDWLNDIRRFDLRPYGEKLPRRKLPDVEIDLRLEIPGDIVRRATVARMLDPAFSISTATTMGMIFPEIPSPVAEQAKAQRDKAMVHPVMTSLYLYEALKQRADMLAAQGDGETAALYRRVADAIMRGQPTPPRQAPEITPIPEVQPREEREFPLF